MRYPDHEDQKIFVLDGIDDSIPANSETIPLTFPGKLLRPVRARLVAQRTDMPHDSLAVLLLVHGLDLPGRGRLDQDPITFHAA
jgi:hypothetical protein